MDKKILKEGMQMTPVMLTRRSPNGDEKAITAVILSVIDAYKEQAWINYYNPNETYQTSRSAYLSELKDLKVLEGAEAAAVMKAFRQCVVKHNYYPVLYDCAWKMKLGSDPEIFIEAGGKIVPAFEFLPSKKDAKAPTSHGKLYWDGFQAEFETFPYACIESHNSSIASQLGILNQFAKVHNPNARLSGKTVVEVDAETLKTAKKEHVEFGCMPSFNAYGLEGLTVPGRECTFRPAGGHIHFGIGPQEPETYVTLVRAMDAIAGVASVALFAGHEDPRRRKLYGLAGEFRTPPHGLEYRTLSNAWLMSPITMQIMFDLARMALRLAFFGGIMQDFQATEAEVVRCLQRTDVKLARSIIRRNREFLIKYLTVVYNQGSNQDEHLKYATRCAKFVVRALLLGVGSIVKEPTQVEHNWFISDDSKTVWGAVDADKGLELDNNYETDSVAVEAA